MSRPARRGPVRHPVREALLAGAVVGGVFLSMLGALRAGLRLGLIPRNELGLLLPLAVVIVLVPLAAGIRLGYRDDVPPSLRAYRHALPWSRSPVEELLGAVLGGAFWGSIGMALTLLADRLPVVGAGAMVAAVFGPALAAGALAILHARGWRTGQAIVVVTGIVFLLAAPQLLLGPRGPLGGPHALGVLAREQAEIGARTRRQDALREAFHLAYQGCEQNDPRSCLLASFYAPTDAPAALLDDLTRRGCDLTTTDLSSCSRLIGSAPFQSSAAGPPACSVEERCVGGYGVECRSGLLACKRAFSSQPLQPVCARREASGWREVWCPRTER